MNKHELVDALQELALDSKEIAIALDEHAPEADKARELRGAAEIMLDWADHVLDKINEERGEENE